jgi:hypothetical protein
VLRGEPVVPLSHVPFAEEAGRRRKAAAGKSARSGDTSARGEAITAHGRG